MIAGLAWLWPCGWLEAGRAEFTSEIWRRNQGLPGDWIEALRFSRDGYLWLGTPEGLVRYDGRVFTHFNSENCPSFDSEVVKDIVEDADGVLWVATKRGLLCFGRDGTGRRFTVSEGLASDDVNALTIGSDHSLWAGTSGGLCRFDGERWVTLPNPNARGWQVAILSLISTDDALYVGGFHGLDRVDLDGGGFSHLWSEKGELRQVYEEACSVQSLALDLNGDLWCGHPGAVTRIALGDRDKATPAAETFRVRPAEASQRVKAIHCDHEGTVRAVIGHVIYEIDAVGELVPFAAGASLGEVVFNDLVEDGRGDLWVASRYGGLARLHRARATVFTTLHGLPHNAVRTATPSSRGGVWVGTRKGVAHVDAETGRIDPVILADVSEHLEWAPQGVSAVFEDSRQLLWCGLAQWPDNIKPSQGMVVLETNSSGVLREYARVLSGGVNPSGAVEDDEGSVWIHGEHGFQCVLPGRPFPRHLEYTILPWKTLSWYSLGGPEKCEFFVEGIGSYWSGRSDGSGDFAWNDTTARITPVGTWLPTRELVDLGVRFDFNRIPKRVPLRPAIDYDAAASLRGRDGSLWFGCGDGLHRFRNHRFETFAGESGVPGRVRAIYEDGEDGALWLATEKGLARLRSGVVSSLVHTDEALGGELTGIVDDGTGHLWFGGEHGIVRAPLDQLEAAANGVTANVDTYLFAGEEGVLSAEPDAPSHPSACRAADGSLWFATSQGLVRIDPASVTSRPEPRLSVVVEEIDFVGRPLPAPARPLPLPEYREARPLVLPPGAGRRIRLRFAAPDPGGEPVDFRYRLEGYEEEWQGAESDRVANYANLPSGEFTFVVEAPHGQHAARLAFRVEPSFHQTTWFRTVTVALGLLAGAAVWRWCAHRQMQTALRLERRRFERDLHDEVGSDFNAIDNWVEVLRRRAIDPGLTAAGNGRTESDGNPDGVLDRLAEAVRQAKTSLRRVREHASEYPVPVDEAIESVTALVRHRLDAVDIASSITAPEDGPGASHALLAAPVQAALVAAVKEVCANIANHSGAASASTLWRLESRFLICEIADDGAGLPRRVGNPSAAARHAKGGNGLGNIRSRLREVGGRVTVRSVTGSGVAVVLRVPLTFQKSVPPTNPSQNP